MARNAALEKSMGRPRRKPVAVIAHVAFSGVPVRLLIAAHTRYKGTPPSLENDHSILQKHITALMQTSLSYLQKSCVFSDKVCVRCRARHAQTFAIHVLPTVLLIHAR